MDRSYHESVLRDGGGPASQLRSTIALLGYNKDVDIELGTVTSVAPLRVQIDGMKFALEANEMVLNRSLTDHDVLIRYDNGTAETITVMGALRVGERVIVSERGQTYFVIGRAVTYAET